MLKNIQHAVIGLLLFGFPLILSSHSPVLDLSIGTILTYLYHWILPKPVV